MIEPPFRGVGGSKGSESDDLSGQKEVNLLAGGIDELKQSD